MRLGARMLVKYPVLTLVGILSLAFAVFVGSIGFEMLTRIVFPRISFEQPGRIVQIRFLDPGSLESQSLPMNIVLSWRDRVTSIQGLVVLSSCELSRLLSRPFLGSKKRVSSGKPSR